MDKLQQIKNDIENQMIFLEGYLQDIPYKDEVKWLIKRVETLENLTDMQDKMSEHDDRLYKELLKENEKLKEKVKWLEMHNDQLQDTDYEVEVKSSFKF